MRDRLADSRFDIMRLRFRSSMREPARFGLGSSEPELLLAEFRFGWFGSIEPVLEIRGSGDWMVEKRSEPSQEVVKPLPKAGSGLP